MKAGRGGLAMKQDRFEGKWNSTLPMQEAWIVLCSYIPPRKGDVKIGSMVPPELVLWGVRKNLSIMDCMSNSQ